MLPTDDQEFILLYIVYSVLFLFLLLGTIFAKNNKRFRRNLWFFLIYTAILSLVFMDADNFKYGSSLVVLFYGGILIVLHLIIFICYTIFKAFDRRKAKR